MRNTQYVSAYLFSLWVLFLNTFSFDVYKRVREIEVLEITFVCIRRRREQQKKNVAHEEVSEIFVARDWLQGPIPLSALFLPQLFLLL